MNIDRFEEHARKAFESHGVDPDAVSYCDECEECERIKEENERLKKEMAEAGKTIESLRAGEETLQGAADYLRRELAKAKEKKEAELTTQAYDCPHCRSFINMRGDVVLKNNAYWHEACWLKSRRNKKFAKGRRRLRRWRNFKFFLARAFWFIW